MTFTIEDALTQHLDRLCEIEKECFMCEAFKKEQISELLKDYNSISLVAKEHGEIIGFIIGTIHVEKEFLVGHILTIDVSRKNRGKGVGHKLLCEIEQIFKEKGVGTCVLEVRENNLQALELYSKAGYKHISKLENYYGSAHGLRMRKTLV